MSALLDHNILCPYCNESITILIDPSVEEQSYIEDCQVCCQPILFKVVIYDGEITDIAVFQDNE